MIHILHSRPRVGDSILEGLAGQASATVHEAMGRRGALDPAIKPLAKGMKLAGRALTVQCHPGDNLMLVKAISMAEKGDVIAVNMGGLTDIGPFGEILATECLLRGLGGLVFDCCVRDSAEIIRLGLPVFSKGLCIRGTAKATLGSINHPLSLGGQLLRPGDILLGDDDGVVVIPYEEAAGVLEAARARVEKEKEILKRIRAGESSFDIYGYQATLERLGCREE